MKKNVKFSETVAIAIKDIGVETLTFVPGYGGNEVFTEVCKVSGKNYDICFHEEVAYTIAHGTSVVGKRAVSLMKTQGVVKASNAVVGSLCSGVTGGFVIIAFNDKEGYHSDCLFNINEMFNGLGIPYHIANMDLIYDDIFSCFKESEAIQLPVALIIDSNKMNIECSFEPQNMPEVNLKYERNVYHHVLMPPANVYQKRILDSKKNNSDWQNIDIPVLPQVPQGLAYEIWKKTATQYQQMFEIFKTIRGEVVTGDSGVSGFFAFPPYNCIDILTYLGCSIPLAIGAYLGGYKDVWAVTGDFTFISAGHLGIIEAVHRDIPIKTLILDNGQSACTGGHEIYNHTLELLLSGYSKYVRYIEDPQNAEEIMTVLTEANNADQLRIVVAKYR